MPPLVIEIVLPRDRRQLGELSLLAADGGIFAGPFVAYGKADNAKAAANGNRARDPLFLWGDTPEGGYAVCEVVRTGGDTRYPSANYGPHAALSLDPVEGQALQSKLNGRTGLYIHSGRPSDSGGLRPTYGCVRLSDDDMLALLEAMTQATGAADFCAIPPEALSVRVLPGKATAA